jgi:hypothetical protein
MVPCSASSVPLKDSIGKHRRKGNEWRFHVRHITGVIDRLFTYARGNALSTEQLAAIQSEAVWYPLSVTFEMRFIAESVSPHVSRSSQSAGSRPS